MPTSVSMFVASAALALLALAARAAAAAAGGGATGTASAHEQFAQHLLRPAHEQLLDMEIFSSDVPSVQKEGVSEIAAQAYTQKGRPSSDYQHELLFVIRRRNVETMQRILQEISDPASEHYGEFVSRASISSLAGNNMATKHVETYLRQAGVQNMTVDLRTDSISATATIGVWEALLHCSFYLFDDGIYSIVRSRTYSLDSSIADDVHTLFGATDLPDPHARPLSIPAAATRTASSTDAFKATNASFATTRRTRESGDADDHVTPALLMRVYGIASEDQQAPLASQAVFSTLHQSYSPNDVAAFQEAFSLPRATVTANVGGDPVAAYCQHEADDCREGNLNVEYMLALAPAVPLTHFSWNGADFIVGWLLQLLAMESVPSVVSISYAIDEAFVSAAYAEVFDVLALQLSLRGVTLVVASGDDGAVGTSARRNTFFCGYRTSFPATSPYVTAVGATMGPESERTEVVCQSDRGGVATSGGGFSALYPTPAFQTDTVAAYMSAASADAKTKPVPGYPMHGRGIPDLALLGRKYHVVSGDERFPVSGTSASAPVFAAMVALVNAARAEAGKGPLGWLNPALYANASSFARDITSGHNRCGAKALTCCQQGFQALAGWDPVSGWGSVDFPLFKAALLALGGSAAEYALPSKPSDSSAPTVAPTTAPAPTPVPAEVGKGWLSMRHYADDYCHGKVTSVASIVTDTCLQNWVHGEAHGSMDVRCTDDTVVVRRYSDLHCSKELRTSQFSGSLGCAYAAGYYYDSLDSFSANLICSNATRAPAPPALVEYADPRFLVHWGFSGDGECGKADLNSADAMLTDSCSPNYHFQMSAKYDSSSGELLTFQGLDCSTESPARKELPSACVATKSYTSDLFFYNYYYGGNGGEGIAVTGTSERWTPSNTTLFVPDDAEDAGSGSDLLGTDSSPFWAFIITFALAMSVMGAVFLYLFKPEWLPFARRDPRTVGMMRLPTSEEDVNDEEGVAMNRL